MAPWYKGSAEMEPRDRSAYRAANRAQRQAYNRQWALENPEKAKAASAARYLRRKADGTLRSTKEYNTAYHRLRKFGLSQADYDTMLLQQEGVCACCKSPPGARQLHVDHDHATGKIRALLCNRCNGALGFLEHPLRPIWEAYLSKHKG